MKRELKYTLNDNVKLNFKDVEINLLYNKAK